MISFILHFTCQGQLVISLMWGEKPASDPQVRAQGICASTWFVAFYPWSSFALCIKDSHPLDTDGKQHTYITKCQIMDSTVCPAIKSELFLCTLIIEALLDLLLFQWGELNVNKVNLFLNLCLIHKATNGHQCTCLLPGAKTGLVIWVFLYLREPCVTNSSMVQSIYADPCIVSQDGPLSFHAPGEERPSSCHCGVVVLFYGRSCNPLQRPPPPPLPPGKFRFAGHVWRRLK